MTSSLFLFPTFSLPPFLPPPSLPEMGRRVRHCKHLELGGPGLDPSVATSESLPLTLVPLKQPVTQSMPHGFWTVRDPSLWLKAFGFRSYFGFQDSLIHSG